MRHTAPETALGATAIAAFLVKAIVEAHGGEVHVRSEPNVGSTFELCFQLG